MDGELEVYKNMLYDMVNTALPDDWIKEIDPEGNIVYYNVKSNQTRTDHPYIKKFRTLFM